MAKQWAWSYSKLKNFETCPKRHYEVDIAKSVKEAEGEALVWGNRVHAELAKACSLGGTLPAEMAEYMPWVEKVRAGAGELMVEQKYAITKEFGKTDWFAPNAWFRSIGDVVRVTGRAALILDWKTGKVVEEPVQLALMAQCIFAHYPTVEIVQSKYVWLKYVNDEDQADTTTEYFRRHDMPGLWASLLGRVSAMEQAHLTSTYPPKPGFLCKRYCPVVSCPHHGKDNR